MDTVRVSLNNSEKVFPCCNQLNSFNGKDLSWALRVGCKSFIQGNSDIFRFHFLIFKVLSNNFKVFLNPIIMVLLNAVLGHVQLSNNFKVFLNHIIMVFLNAVFGHVQLLISSIVVFNTFMYARCSFTDVLVFSCWCMAVHMIY